MQRLKENQDLWGQSQRTKGKVVERGGAKTGGNSYRPAGAQQSVNPGVENAALLSHS